MHIGLDARMIAYSGIGTYLRCLLSELSVLPGEEEYILFGKDAEVQGSLGAERCRVITWKVGPYDPWSLFMHPINKSNVDLFHCPHYNLPFGIRRPCVVTIHDLIHLICPDLLSDRRAHWYASWMLPSAAHRAAHILTVSEHSKRDILKYLNVPESKVTVISHGVSSGFRPYPRSEIQSYRALRKLPERFILYVGLLKPHKNIVRLVKAFSILQDTGLHLLLVGRSDKEYRSLNRVLADESLSQRIILYPAWAYEELPLLYNAAECLVLPSLYEGFGLPALEAMACGTPVICSQTTSLPEVVGDAAKLVDPISVESIRDGLKRMLMDSSLRAEMSRKGLVRAKRFRWHETAVKTLQVYREVANR